MDDWDDDASYSRYGGDQAPPYAGMEPSMGMSISVGVDSPEPYTPPLHPSYSPQNIALDRGISAGMGTVHQRQPFPHSMSSPQILAPPDASTPPPPPAAPPTSPQEMRVVLPPRRRSGIGGEVQRAGSGAAMGLGVTTTPPAPPPPGTAAMSGASSTSWKRDVSPGVQFVPSLQMHEHQHQHHHHHHHRAHVQGGEGAGETSTRGRSHQRAQSATSLHPYVRSEFYEFRVRSH